MKTDASSLFTTPEEKRSFVQRLFTRIAPRYDWFNRLASMGLDQGWRLQALDRGGIGPGQCVLDLCTGTGDLAVLCTRRQQPVDSRHGLWPQARSPARPGGQAGTVVGMDMNGAMLTHAQRKQRALGLTIDWVQGEAESLPFSNGTFDRVVIGFSTRNLTHLMEGLREMVRVLRPQGRLVILETGYPANPALRAAYQTFLFTGVRLIGFLLTGRTWPFTYLARSVRGFLTPEQMVEHLQSLRTQVEYVPLSCGLASLFIATKT